MRSSLETIYARITGAGTSAVAGYRLSGSDAWAIANRIVTEPVLLSHRLAAVANLSNGETAVLLPFQAPQSFTGEDVLEVFIHGGEASARSFELLIGAHCRLAHPGEFTERAFLNGKLDLTAAESIHEIVTSRNSAALRASLAQNKGSLFDAITDIQQSLETVLAQLAAIADYAEELEDYNPESAAELLRHILNELNRLFAKAGSGARLKVGFRVALEGPPNAGKSSLFNALVGRDRAIVTAVPGTTRDSIEENVEWGGVPILLQDLAGIRETEDEVEAEGVRRSLAAVEGADLIIHVRNPASKQPQVGNSPLAETKSSEEGKPEASELLVWTHQDLLPNGAVLNSTDHEGTDKILISSLSGFGINLLKEKIVEELKTEELEVDYVLNDRHQRLLSSAIEAVQLALAASEENRPADLVVTCVQEANFHLDSITGKQAQPMDIESIFSKFCFGK